MNDGAVIRDCVLSGVLADAGTPIRCYRYDIEKRVTPEVSDIDIEGAVCVLCCDVSQMEIHYTIGLGYA